MSAPRASEALIAAAPIAELRACGERIVLRGDIPGPMNPAGSAKPTALWRRPRARSRRSIW